MKTNSREEPLKLCYAILQNNTLYINQYIQIKANRPTPTTQMTENVTVNTLCIKKPSTFTMILSAMPYCKAVFFCSTMQINLALRCITKRKNFQFSFCGGIAHLTIPFLVAKCWQMYRLKRSWLPLWRFIHRRLAILIKSSQLSD